MFCPHGAPRAHGFVTLAGARPARNTDYYAEAAGFGQKLWPDPQIFVPLADNSGAWATQRVDAPAPSPHSVIRP